MRYASSPNAPDLLSLIYVCWMYVLGFLANCSCFSEQCVLDVCVRFPRQLLLLFSYGVTSRSLCFCFCGGSSWAQAAWANAAQSAHSLRTVHTARTVRTLCAQCAQCAHSVRTVRAPYARVVRTCTPCAHDAHAHRLPVCATRWHFP